MIAAAYAGGSSLGSSFLDISGARRSNGLMTARMVLVAMRVYSAVVSSLCPAGHRLDYVPCRTMSRCEQLMLVCCALTLSVLDIGSDRPRHLHRSGIGHSCSRLRYVACTTARWPGDLSTYAHVAAATFAYVEKAATWQLCAAMSRQRSSKYEYTGQIDRRRLSRTMSRSPSCSSLHSKPHHIVHNGT